MFDWLQFLKDCDIAVEPESQVVPLSIKDITAHWNFV